MDEEDTFKEPPKALVEQCNDTFTQACLVCMIFPRKCIAHDITPDGKNDAVDVYLCLRQQIEAIEEYEAQCNVDMEEPLEQKLRVLADLVGLCNDLLRKDRDPEDNSLDDEGNLKRKDNLLTIILRNSENVERKPKFIRDEAAHEKLIKQLIRRETPQVRPKFYQNKSKPWNERTEVFPRRKLGGRLHTWDEIRDPGYVDQTVEWEDGGTSHIRIPQFKPRHGSARRANDAAQAKAWRKQRVEQLRPLMLRVGYLLHSLDAEFDLSLHELMLCDVLEDHKRMIEGDENALDRLRHRRGQGASENVAQWMYDNYEYSRQYCYDLMNKKAQDHVRKQEDSNWKGFPRREYDNLDAATKYFIAGSTRPPAEYFGKSSTAQTKYINEEGYTAKELCKPTSPPDPYVPFGGQGNYDQLMDNFFYRKDGESFPSFLDNSEIRQLDQEVLGGQRVPAPDDQWKEEHLATYYGTPTEGGVIAEMPGDRAVGAFLADGSADLGSFEDTSENPEEDFQKFLQKKRMEVKPSPLVTNAFPPRGSGGRAPVDDRFAQPDFELDDDFGVGSGFDQGAPPAGFDLGGISDGFDDGGFVPPPADQDFMGPSSGGRNLDFLGSPAADLGRSLLGMGSSGSQSSPGLGGGALSPAASMQEIMTMNDRLKRRFPDTLAKSGLFNIDLSGISNRSPAALNLPGSVEIAENRMSSAVDVRTRERTKSGRMVGNTVRDMKDVRKSVEKQLVDGKEFQVVTEDEQIGHQVLKDKSPRKSYDDWISVKRGGERPLIEWEGPERAQEEFDESKVLGQMSASQRSIPEQEISATTLSNALKYLAQIPGTSSTTLIQQDRKAMITQSVVGGIDETGRDSNDSIADLDLSSFLKRIIAKGSSPQQKPEHDVAHSQEVYRPRAHRPSNRKRTPNKPTDRTFLVPIPEDWNDDLPDKDAEQMRSDGEDYYYLRGESNSSLISLVDSQTEPLEEELDDLRDIDTLDLKSDDQVYGDEKAPWMAEDVNIGRDEYPIRGRHISRYSPSYDLIECLNEIPLENKLSTIQELEPLQYRSNEEIAGDDSLPYLKDPSLIPDVVVDREFDAFLRDLDGSEHQRGLTEREVMEPHSEPRFPYGEDCVFFSDDVIDPELNEVEHRAENPMQVRCRPRFSYKDLAFLPDNVLAPEWEDVRGHQQDLWQPRDNRNSNAQNPYEQTSQITIVESLISIKSVSQISFDQLNNIDQDAVRRYNDTYHTGYPSSSSPGRDRYADNYRPSSPRMPTRKRFPNYSEASPPITPEYSEEDLSPPLPRHRRDQRSPSRNFQPTPCLDEECDAYTGSKTGCNCINDLSWRRSRQADFEKDLALADRVRGVEAEYKNELKLNAHREYKPLRRNAQTGEIELEEDRWTTEVNSDRLMKVMKKYADFEEEVASKVVSSPKPASPRTVPSSPKEVPSSPKWTDYAPVDVASSETVEVSEPNSSETLVDTPLDSDVSQDNSDTEEEEEKAPAAVASPEPRVASKPSGKSDVDTFADDLPPEFLDDAVSEPAEAPDELDMEPFGVETDGANQKSNTDIDESQATDSATSVPEYNAEPEPLFDEPSPATPAPEQEETEEEYEEDEDGEEEEEEEE